MPGNDACRDLPLLRDGIRRAFGGCAASLVQLDVPVREIEEILPHFVMLVAEDERNDRTPFGRTGFRMSRMSASCGRRFAFFVLHLMHEQTIFSHVVFPPWSRGMT